MRLAIYPTNDEERRLVDGLRQHFDNYQPMQFCSLSWDITEYEVVMELTRTWVQLELKPVGR